MLPYEPLKLRPYSTIQICLLLLLLLSSGQLHEYWNNHNYIQCSNTDHTPHNNGASLQSTNIDTGATHIFHKHQTHTQPFNGVVRDCSGEKRPSSTHTHTAHIHKHQNYQIWLNMRKVSFGWIKHTNTNFIKIWESCDQLVCSVCNWQRVWSITRWIKEAVHIRKEGPRSMNRDTYDCFLGSTLTCRAKNRKKTT